ncbi:hypothetical protein GLU01_01775 [Nanohaloarchaea archaeon]|mgnify:CR=1 FL=1|nr:hypothetical protein [Candidatus Nanohaloarchaea archaeon]
MVENREKAEQYHSKMISKSYVERNKMGVDDPYIVVENGVLDLIQESLHDFDPELLARHKLPVECDSDAGEPEAFLDYLDNVVTSE